LKILHTSDWHLGQYFMGKSRRQEHKQFLDWLVACVVKEQVEVVIVAGDIFDTGAPPSYARELYHQFIIEYSKATENSVPLIIVAGNHDSAAMLEETSGLLAHFNTHVCTAPQFDNPERDVLSIYDGNEALTGIVCSVPFLRARDMISSNAGMTGKEKQQDLQGAIQAYYADLYQIALDRRGSHSKVPIIMTGHLTVVGAKCSDSVRDIYIGTLEAFSAAYFPPASYVALGHIHKTQAIGAAQSVYYSGSPIPLSFDELSQEKSVLIVNCDDLGTQVRSLPIPHSQAMYKLKGSLQSIENQIDGLTKQHLQTDGEVWLEIEVEEQDYLNDLQKRVEEMLEGTSLEVLRLKRSRKRVLSSLEGEKVERLQELSPTDVFEKRLALEGDAIDSDLRSRITSKFEDALNSISGEE
jgi:DNA repair protein SbcD/Mre11